MKKLILALFLCISLFTRAQEGAAIVAAVSLGHYVENQNLKQIVQNEVQITALQTAIAQETFVIKELEQKLFNSLSNVQSVITNAQQVIDITKLGEDIGFYQQKIAEAAGEDPQLVIVALEAEVIFLEKSANLLTEIFLATIGGETNLMNNKERLDLLDRILDDMTELRNNSYTLWIQMKAAARLNLLETLDFVNFDWGIDVNGLHQAALENIRGLENILGQ